MLPCYLRPPWTDAALLPEAPLNWGHPEIMLHLLTESSPELMLLPDVAPVTWGPPELMVPQPATVTGVFSYLEALLSARHTGSIFPPYWSEKYIISASIIICLNKLLYTVDWVIYGLKSVLLQVRFTFSFLNFVITIRSNLKYCISFHTIFSSTVYLGKCEFFV